MIFCIQWSSMQDISKAEWLNTALALISAWRCWKLHIADESFDCKDVHPFILYLMCEKQTKKRKYIVIETFNWNFSDICLEKGRCCRMFDWLRKYDNKLFWSSLKKFPNIAWKPSTLHWLKVHNVPYICSRSQIYRYQFILWCMSAAK